MNHFVDLTSAHQNSRDAAATPLVNAVLNHSALEMGFMSVVRVAHLTDILALTNYARQ